MASATLNKDSRSDKSWSCRHSTGRSCSQRWGGVNIAVMVLGFVMFWPAGLLILAWIMSGRDVRDLPNAIKARWQQFFGGNAFESHFSSGSDNIVFNEYQQTQYDRIAEIKNEIRERARRFRDYSIQAKRRADQEEFDNFMASTPGGNNSVN